MAPLLHRLSIYEIWIPPLRERRDDMTRLLMHVLKLELSRSGDARLLEQQKPGPWLTMEIVKRLVEYEWPGNVRQLRNAVGRLVLGSRGSPVASLQTTSSLGADEIRACHEACDGDLDTMVERRKVSKPALRRRLSKMGLP